MKKVRVASGVAGVASIVIALAIMPRIQQQKASICFESGVRLTETDLRKKVIAEFINGEINRVCHQDTEYLPGVLSIWAGAEISDEQIAKAVIAVKNGRDPFVSDHGFKRLRPTASDLAASQIQEPFLLLTSDAIETHVSIRRVASQGIQRVQRVVGYRPSLLQRMQGFGSHFY